MSPAAEPGASGRSRTRAADLASYYDAEIDERAARALSQQREACRDSFIEALAAEGTRSLLEIGCGPGIDGVDFAASGFDYIGIDISVAATVMCRGQNLRVAAASAVALPFADALFDAGWTMSTLMHLDDRELGSALDQLRPVIRSGGLLAIGVWGHQVTREEYVADKTGERAARYFRLRSDDNLRDALGRFGQIMRWVTWRDDSPYHYQWALIRRNQMSMP